MKINSISPLKHKYLQITTTIAQKPDIFYFIGTLPAERRPSVAIVGTRKPTAYGKEVTYRIAYDLARKGIIIISGLALGVDSIAHQAALDAGGTTLAVLGNGLDEIYPAKHRALAEQIVKNGGAILSEYEPDVPARDFQFLARNRLVSALSDAVVVTEAAKRSGTLATVNHALDQGREVFAVPGNITSPLSDGCNAIPKQGAHILTSADDVLAIVAADKLNPQTSLMLGNNQAETTILTLLQTGLRDGDDLQQQSGLTAADFSTALTMLELDGSVRALGGNQWTIK